MKIAVDGVDCFVIVEMIGTVDVVWPLPQIRSQRKELSVYHDRAPAHVPGLCLCLDLGPYRWSRLSHEASEFGLRQLFDIHDQC